MRYGHRKDGSYVEIECDGRAVATLTTKEFMALVDKLEVFCAIVSHIEQKKDIGWLVCDDCSDCGIDDSGGLVLRNLVEDEEAW